MTVAEARQQRAEVLAASWHSWIPATNRHDGSTVFGIPSQVHAGQYHLATMEFCSCRDSSYRSGACKHRRALAIVARHYTRVPRPTLRRRFAIAHAANRAAWLREEKL
jgi:hypothetical protein